MKRLFKVIAGVLLVGLLAGCSSSAGGSDDDDSGNKMPSQAELVAARKAAYRELVGTKWRIDEYDTVTDYSPAVMVFADDSILFDNVQHSVSFYQNVFLPSEVDAKIKKFEGTIYFLIDSKYIGLDTDFTGKDSFILKYYDSYDNIQFKSYCKDLSYGGNPGGEGNDASYAGTYSYTGATGNEMNGSVTLADGSWSYSGSKTNMAAKNGSYTTSGSKVTFKWSASGYDMSDTFTVSDMGSGKVKLVCDNSVNSMFLNMVFGMAGAGKTEIVLSKN